ncbi:MAG: glycosyltransferase [Deltaproteobacteria bacterium]
MSPYPKASIIITSYNQRPTLELLLATLERQTIQDFEVIIADDGSSDGTDQLCSRQDKLNLRFETQPDIGYRKAKILNQAIRATRAPYLIFLDADTILERHFVEDHLRLSRPSYFVCGRRVELGPELSRSITLDKVRQGWFDGFNFQLLKSVFKKDSEHFNRSIRVTNSYIRKIAKYDKPLDILGSNLSVWKDDIVEINGFNEAMESYWGEDGDLYIRLRNTGKKAIGAKAICVQFHVFHKRREPTKEHVESYYRMLKDTDYKWAKQGLSFQSI